jgi:uncharacterized repeat protein (TIGR01451 family)
MFIRKSLLASTILPAILATPVLAQGEVELEGGVEVLRIVEQNGERVETYSEPTRVIPGDRLKFTTTYRNNTGHTVEDFVITNPLPKPVVLTEIGEFEVSVDDGKSFGSLETRSIDLPDGGKRPATLDDVEQVRWTIDSIAAGATGQVTYFASVR